MGRGVAGLIGHTQPRRIAARSVAARIAEEIGSPLGRDVGYKVRFSESIGPQSYIKLMTDGILLAETQSDPYFDQYDTIILDEAHERSLNVDFLIGYLKRLLPKRPDLRLIITSATIDAARFAEHFATRGRTGAGGRGLGADLSGGSALAADGAGRRRQRARPAGRRAGGGGGGGPHRSRRHARSSCPRNATSTRRPRRSAAGRCRATARARRRKSCRSMRGFRSRSSSGSSSRGPSGGWSSPPTWPSRRSPCRGSAS